MQAVENPTKSLCEMGAFVVPLYEKGDFNDPISYFDSELIILFKENGYIGKECRGDQSWAIKPIPLWGSDNL